MLKKINFTAIIATFFLLFILTSSTSAKDEWIRVQSKNFNLVGNAGEKDIRKVGTRLEQFRETFHRLFKSANLDAAIPTTVVVFKSDGAYRPYKPKKANGKIDNFVAGYFQPGQDVNFITLSTEGEDKDTFGTIFHEYVHFMLEMNYGKSEIPVWFNEGLAEYYQTFEIEKDQILKLGLFQQGHLDTLQTSKLIPLDTLFNISSAGLHENGDQAVSIFYAQAWALVHYLIQGQKGTKSESLNNFIAGLVKNVPPEKAFKDAFQMSYADMEKELKKYVNLGTYNYNVIEFKQKLEFDSQMVVSKLTEAESNTYLGDLLLHTRRMDDAEPLLQKALAADPQSNYANTAMGMVKVRQRKFAEAKPFLEKAISGDVKNHIAYYNYALLLSKEGRDEFGFVSKFPAETSAKMREILAKAIEINPSYTESYDLLAFVSMVNNENLPEAFETLKKGLKYQPGNQSIVLRLAEILLRLEKFDDAKFLAEKIAKSGEDEQMKDRANRILGDIESRESMKARNDAMAAQYAERMKAMENQRAQNSTSGSGPTATGGKRLVRRQRERTPEEIAKEEALQKLISINQAISKTRDGEKQIIGRISKITCPPKTVVYSVKTETGNVSLFSKDFQSLTLVAFESAAQDVGVGCNAEFSKFNAVLTYRVAAPGKSTHLGELIAIDFVPDDFQFVDPNTVASTQTEEVVEVPPTPSGQRIETSGAVSGAVVMGNGEQPDFDKMRREAMMKSMREALRKPADGELRAIGNVEKIECDKNGMFIVLASAGQTLRLKSTPNIEIKIFVPDLGGMQFGCGMNKLDESVVFVYKPVADKKTKSVGEVVSLEFVPKSLTLD